MMFKSNVSVVISFQKQNMHILQLEIVAKLFPKTFFYVTEMQISKKIIPKLFFHVIL